MDKGGGGSWKLDNFHGRHMCITPELIDLKDWLKRNNLRIDNIKERRNELWEDCEKELDTLFNLFKDSLVIEQEVVIEREHRVKTDKNKKKS